MKLILRLERKVRTTNNYVFFLVNLYSYQISSLIQSTECVQTEKADFVGTNEICIDFHVPFDNFPCLAMSVRSSTEQEVLE